jgi:hypothetical protein
MLIKIIKVLHQTAETLDKKLIIYIILTHINIIYLYVPRCSFVIDVIIPFAPSAMTPPPSDIIIIYSIYIIIMVVK